MMLRPVGYVRSPLRDPGEAPKQGSEGGAPSAWIELEPTVDDGARDIHEGDELLVLTWLHRADRNTVVVHPRDDPAAPLTGVFSTRSADRPNPIGIHRVHVRRVEGRRVLVDDLEAVDGTPVIDLKPVLDPAER